MSDESTRQLVIKNMVCPRCIMVVRQTLSDLGISVKVVELGKAVIENPENIPNKKIEEALSEYGFEILEGHDEQTVEKIKTNLLEYVNRSEREIELPKISEYLSDRLNRNYASLSKLFSRKEEITIEKYLIRLRIERVKELLSYDEMTLSEIAWKLNYSSVQHLSNQFKQVTGMSVTDYKKAKDSFRNTLDELD